MIKYDEIQDVHLEISSLCNASCPLCPRTFWGYPYNGGYPEINMTLDMAQKIFSKNFLCQLKSLCVNGNYGDIVMNPDGASIIHYFRSVNENLDIAISTNGGARNQKFWEDLARSGAKVMFCLDGLSDTHHLYRQNTLWSTVIKNAKIFMQAGGQAIWKMIRFNHNEHQIEDCRLLSKKLGFVEFLLVDEGRNTAPVFDRHGNLVHVLGDYRGEKEFKILFYKKTNDDVLLEDIILDRTIKKSITCKTKQLKSIYIAANGDVSPCCWTGFYPKTYGHGQYHQAANSQLIPLISKNNALEHTIEKCIQWFAEVEKSWNIDSYQQGRLVICEDNCGN